MLIRFFGKVLLGALLITGRTPAAAWANQVDVLDGWREFHFGMSAEEVGKVTTIPLKCSGLSGRNTSRTASLYNGMVRISDVDLRVVFNFVNIPPDAQGCTGGYLAQISFQKDSVAPCPARKLLEVLEDTYGPFQVNNMSMDVNSAPPRYFVKKFNNNTAIQSTVIGTNSSCEFDIDYMELAKPKLPPPTPPKSNF